MSVARAPGKVVLSGAYAVLSGAPAIVSAVDRYVLADSSRGAELVTPEVLAALGSSAPAPWFDASALRAGARKLGLGSSAAILVASLFALERDATPSASDEALRERVFGRALAAHRAAQAGGSGVDVAASTYGGTLCYQLASGGPSLRALAMPAELALELWSSPVSASTRELLKAVARLAEAEPVQHQRLISVQAAAAERALLSLSRGDAAGFISALRAQHRVLVELGRAAGVAIVTPELSELEPSAEAEGGVLLPAGAGGGDIALFAGSSSSTRELRAALEARSHQLLHAALAAPGVGPA